MQPCPRRESTAWGLQKDTDQSPGVSNRDISAWQAGAAARCGAVLACLTGGLTRRGRPMTMRSTLLGLVLGFGLLFLGSAAPDEALAQCCPPPPVCCTPPTPP